MTTTARPDYWSLLGVEPNCDQNQLKRAFRREARKWHPDLNNNDRNAEERFKLINEAYAILSDPKKRKDWEKDNTNSENNDPFKVGFPTFEEYLEVILGEKNEEEKVNIEEELDYYDTNEEYIENFDSNDNDFTPTKTDGTPPPIPIYENLETLIEITPEEALYGTITDIELQDGTLIELKTPPFAGDGWRLRIEGAAMGLKDHFVQLKVQTEEGLRIDGLRVFYKLELFPHDALLGCAVEVPTLTGYVTLQVPPNSSSGRLLRLRGRGLEYENIKGDQIVEVTIVLPSDITDAEIALYTRLQELSIDEQC